MLLLWNGCESGGRRTLFSSGLLCGLAFLMKQQGIFFGAFGGIFLICAGLRNRNIGGTLKDAFAFGAGMIFPFAALCLILKLAGVFNAFWFWTFTYAHSYVALVPWSEGFRMLSLHLMSGFQPSCGFWLLAVLDCRLVYATQKFAARLFLSRFVDVFLFGRGDGLYFRGHYFILVLPAASLCIGLAVSALQESLQPRMTALGAEIIPLILFGAIFGWSIFSSETCFLPCPQTRCADDLSWLSFCRSLAVSDYIQAHSIPGDRVAVMGSEPQIYFYSHRHFRPPATSIPTPLSSRSPTPRVCSRK